MRYAVILLIVLVAGCAGDQGNRQQNRFGDLGHVATEGITLPPRRAPVIENELTRADLDTAIDRTRSEFQASQNATSNSLTGVGANIGKLAEELTGLKAEVTTSFKAMFQASADLRVHLSNQVSAEADLRASAVADLRAHVDAKFQALANAQAQAIAGFNNTLQSMQQNISAGRDSNVNQYADQMFRANQTSDRTTMWIVIAMSLGWIATSEMSRQRAERRHREATGKGDQQCELGFIRRWWRWFW